MHAPLRSISILLIAVSSIQFGASFAKQFFTLVNPTIVTMLRTSLAAIFLVLIWRPWRQAIPRESLLAVIPYGVALGLMNLLFYLSLERIPLGIAVALEFTGPLGISLLMSRQKLDILWVLLAALGIYLISPLGSIAGEIDSRGVVFALLAGFCWSLYIFFGKRLSNKLPSGPASALGMVVAALVVLPMGIREANSQLFELKTWGMGLTVAAFSSALPYYLEMVAMKGLTAKSFGILMSLEPALASLMGYTLLDERLNSKQWLAIAFIIIASGGCSLTGSPKKKDANT